MWEATSLIETRLVIKNNGGNWRTDKQYYQPVTHCTYKPGSMNYGLAWFQQGMKVGLLHGANESITDVNITGSIANGSVSGDAQTSQSCLDIRHGGK